MKSNRVGAVQEWLANVDMDEFVRDFLEIQQETCGPTINEYLAVSANRISKHFGVSELSDSQGLVLPTQCLSSLMSSFSCNSDKKPRSACESQIFKKGFLGKHISRYTNKKSDDNKFTTTGCSSGSKYPKAA